MEMKTQRVKRAFEKVSAQTSIPSYFISLSDVLWLEANIKVSKNIFTLDHIDISRGRESVIEIFEKTAWSFPQVVAVVHCFLVFTRRCS